MTKLFNEPMSFENKENEPAIAVPLTSFLGKILKTLKLFKQIWISRSSAGVSLIMVDGNILMVKRSEHCPDERGKWVLPCGYIDWNESIVGGVIREVYEETGLNLPSYRKHLYKCCEVVIDSFTDAHSDSTDLDKEGSPFHIRSLPKNDAKSNISYHMVLKAISDGSAIIPKLPIVNPTECSDVQWLSVEMIENLHTNGMVGFNHIETIRKVL